jgi:hypothetical protein
MARTKQTIRLTDDEIIDLYIAPLLKVHIYILLVRMAEDDEPVDLVADDEATETTAQMLKLTI